MSIKPTSILVYAPDFVIALSTVSLATAPHHILSLKDRQRKSLTPMNARISIFYPKRTRLEPAAGQLSCQAARPSIDNIFLDRQKEDR